MNLSYYSFEHHFSNDNYTIEEVKTVSVFEPKRWSETFKKTLKRHIKEAKILHTSTGLTLPLKRYSALQKKQVLEVAGLQSYNEKSKLKQEFIKENSQSLRDTFINRIDICIDMEKIPVRVLKKLTSTKRKVFQYKNTTYYKTGSEKKTNPLMDIKIYNKALKESLDYPLHRLEFCFKSAYFKGMQLLEIENKLFQKMEKSILKFSGLKVKIQPL